jgi:hypothetical protein
MRIVRISPGKMAAYEALKDEFDTLQKAIDALACLITATKSPPDEFRSRSRAIRLADMRRQSREIENKMIAIREDSSRE